MILRPPEEPDFALLARLWKAAWDEAHGPYVPEALRRLRTLGDFERRLRGFGAATRVAGPPGRPLGFCTIKGAELHQLFVAPQARGTGLAVRLLADGEARLAAAGVPEAWLETMPENIRAIRFYRRNGWRERGVEKHEVDTSEGPYELPLAIFVKTLAPPRG